MTDSPTSPTLAITGNLPVIEITPEATRQKTALLANLAAITAVADNTGRLSALDALALVRDHRLRLEKSREEVKAPVLRLGRLIDSIASDFAKETDTEEKRIKGLLSDYAMRQEKERKRLEQEARAAQEKAAQEKAAAEQAERLAEAERRRQAEEGNRAEDTDDGLEAAGKALAEERRQKAALAIAEAEREKTRAAAEAAGRAASSAAMAAVAIPVTKMALDYEVRNIHEVYEFSRDLVELTPRRREILTLLERLRSAGLKPTVPGLEVREVPKISTR